VRRLLPPADGVSSQAGLPDADCSAGEDLVPGSAVRVVEPEFGSSGNHPVLNEGGDFCDLFSVCSDVLCSCGSDEESEDAVPVPGDEVKDPVFAAAPVDDVPAGSEIAHGKPDGTSSCFAFIRHGSLRFF